MREEKLQSISDILDQAAECHAERHQAFGALIDELVAKGCHPATIKEGLKARGVDLDAAPQSSTQPEAPLFGQQAERFAFRKDDSRPSGTFADATR